MNVEIKGPRNAYVYPPKIISTITYPRLPLLHAYSSRSIQLLLDLILLQSLALLQVFASCMHAYPRSVGQPARSRVFFIPVVLPTVRPCTATGRRCRGRGRRRGRRRNSSGRRHCGGRRGRAGPDELLRREV